MCGGVSTWTVIMRSPDFADNQNRPIDLDALPTEFRIVRPTHSRFVVVMDVSESMNKCVSLFIELQFCLFHFISKFLTSTVHWLYTAESYR